MPRRVITIALPMVWAAAVVAGSWASRPAPPRVRALVRGHRGRRTTPRRSIPESLGVALLRLFRRPDDRLLARRVGTALVLALAAAPVVAAAAPVAGLVGWCWPAARARRDERRRLAALAADLPDVVDLFVLAVGAGLTVSLALATVSRRAAGPLGAELGRACDDVAMGRRLAEALDDVPARAGESVRPLVAALVASERYGAPLAAGLERLAGEVRRDRRRKAEEAARRIPVKLLFPLVGCTLPAFALLTVAPLIAGAVRSLHF
ncbi:MAG: type II secretion system F family protein [Actinobacteria bacterium]|nr:MAG: type II secretion system F family protein [Actinomycetota bacterium]